MSLLKFIKTPYLIAEIGVNHNCNIKLAKQMIKECKLGGATAVKFQFYKAGKIASKDSPAYWDLKSEKTKSQYKLFKKFDSFDFRDYHELYKYCKHIKIDFMCTPFDVDAVKQLNKILKIFKISSSDITNYELLYEISKTNKPVILSTGASNIKDVKEAVKFLKKNGVSDNNIGLLHCVLSYPTLDKDANLQFIELLKKTFPKNIIGYSDHTLPDYGMTSIISAIMNGAKIIEKHYTHNKNLKGNDHYHAMDFKDLINLKSILDKFKVKNKKKTKIRHILSCEKKSMKYARRGIYAKVNIKKGDKITRSNIISKRPAKVSNAHLFFDFLGKVSKVNINEDNIIYSKYLKNK